MARKSASSLADASRESAPRTNPYPKGTEAYYLHEMDFLDDQVRAGKIRPVDAQRMGGYWADQATRRGVDIAEAQRTRLDPLHRFLANPTILGTQEEELLQVADSMNHIDGLDADMEALKKKWVRLIRRGIELQHRARSSAAHMGVYVIRSQEDDSILKMDRIHLDWLRIWLHPESPNSEIMAPPGSGKTTMLYIVELWELADDQTLRILKVCCDTNTASKRLETLRTWVLHPRYRALYPHMRLDYDKPNNTTSFTLIRRNIGSQDPTVEAAGAGTEVQGSGRERIHADDLCPMKVQWEVTTRERIKANFSAGILTRRRNLERSRVRYIATPWHVHDLTCTIKEQIRNVEIEGWRIHASPVEEDDAGRPIPIIVHGERGEADAKNLAQTKRTNPATYRCCYRLNPVDPSQQHLKSLRYYDVSGGKDPLCPDDERERWGALLAELSVGERWKVLDPGGGGRDETGDVNFRLAGTGRAAITGAAQWPYSSEKTIEHIQADIVAESTDKVLMEAAALGKGLTNMWASYLANSLGEGFRQRILFSDTRLRDTRGTPYGVNASKGERFFNSAPYMARGILLFPGEWVKTQRSVQLQCVRDVNLRELHDQLLQFPNHPRDHLVDCVTLFINYNLAQLVRAIELIERPQPVQAIGGPVSVLTRLYRERLDEDRKPQLVGTGTASESEMFRLAG